MEAVEVAHLPPEQAEGKKIDARSDIFSFGSVLYEMLAGRRPFSGDTRLATLTLILHQEPPPLHELAPEIPPELDRIVARCLRKDPARRFQTMGDLKVALEDVQQESASTVRGAGPGARPGHRRTLTLVLVAAGLLLAAGAAWWLTRGRPAAQAPDSPPARLTNDTGLTTDPALSPDGKFVVYASDRAAGSLDIWIQNVATGESNRLTTDPADEREPAFSPDGTRVAFRSEKDGGGVYVVPSIGGPPRLVAREGRRPRFSPDGARLAYYTGSTDVLTGTGSRVYVVLVASGAPVFERLGASHPVWTPDGTRLLVLGGQQAGGRYGFPLDWQILQVDRRSNRGSRGHRHV